MTALRRDATNDQNAISATIGAILMLLIAVVVAGVVLLYINNVSSIRSPPPIIMLHPTDTPSEDQLLVITAQRGIWDELELKGNGKVLKTDLKGSVMGGDTVDIQEILSNNPDFDSFTGLLDLSIVHKPSNSMIYRHTFNIDRVKKITGAWWDPNWIYRRRIEINPAKIIGAHANFPVLVLIQESSITSKAQDDGDDIVFINADGSIKLDHELEYYSKSEGLIIAWVRIPLLTTSDEHRIFYIYYGNPNCGSQENSAGVWDGNYLMVHHLEENSGLIRDSTSNNCFGNAAGGSSYRSAGKIGGAYYFDGNNDYIEIPDIGTVLDFDNQKPYTWDAWVNYQGFPSGYDIQGYLSKDSLWPPTYKQGGRGFNLLLKKDGNVADIVITKPGECPQDHDGDGTCPDYKYTNPGDLNLNSDTWVYLVIVYDGAASWLVYENGVYKAYLQYPTDPAESDTEQPYYIGAATWPWEPSGPAFFFKGMIDEVRVSNSARNAGWITTSYSTMNDPGSFISLGAEEQKK
ncbi:MAG: DUF2341 domain-containing protein [Candidatus Thermoplasmatota archaeon]